MPTSGDGRPSCLSVLSTHFSLVFPACFFQGTVWPVFPLRLVDHMESYSRESLGTNLGDQMSLSQRSCDSALEGTRTQDG